MVADKSKLDKVCNEEEEQCRENNKILNLKSSSSSIGSAKGKSENELSSTDDSLGSSTKDDSEEETNILNSTYSCDKPGKVGSLQSNEIEGGKENYEFAMPASETLDQFWKESYEYPMRAPDWKETFPDLFTLADVFDSSRRNLTAANLKIASLEEFGEAAEPAKEKENEGEEEALLVRMRNRIAEYQALFGTVNKEYSFLMLIRVMGQATGRCLLALCHIILNIAPVLEIFLHILRFIFEKIIELQNTPGIVEKLIKTSLFLLQLLGVYVCLKFIFGFIVLPIVYMALSILAKLMLFN